MTCLLDTHTLLWSIIEPDKISRTATRILEDAHNTILVSAVSLWEISLKYSVGKLDLQGVSPRDFPALSSQSGFVNIPVMPEEAAIYHQLKGTWHGDPFDRMLIWQAIQKSTPLVTKDKEVRLYRREGLKTIW